MGDLRRLREELSTTQDERMGIKKAVKELYERDRELAALQYKLEWSIVNTEIANGIRKEPRPTLVDKEGKNFWDGVVGGPKGKATGKATSKAKKFTAFEDAGGNL
jgi:hypothetical protein